MICVYNIVLYHYLVLLVHKLVDLILSVWQAANEVCYSNRRIILSEHRNIEKMARQFLAHFHVTVMFSTGVT